VEVASGLRRQVAAGALSARLAWTTLNAWRHLAVTRYGLHGVLERIWQLRENVSPSDAGYVALAEVLDCSLVTADGRLARAAGIRCPVTVVPR
jgi:predicted nucleic acid-binding protein